jgi:hypothetical protein
LAEAWIRQVARRPLWPIIFVHDFAVGAAAVRIVVVLQPSEQAGHDVGIVRRDVVLLEHIADDVKQQGSA